MTQFIVKGAALKRDNIESQYGMFKTVTLMLQEYGKDGDPVAAEWYTKQATALPAEGSTIDGDITEDPQWGPKFKKAQGAGGYGGGGGMSEEDKRRITRCHSQEMALRWLEIKLERGEIPADVQLKPELLRPFITWFDEDANEGWKS